MNLAPPYLVRFTPTGLDQSRTLLVRARKAGVWDRVSTAFREIERELVSRPSEWGDPVSHYQAAKIRMYRCLYDEIAVSYGVHDTFPVVWVTRVAAVLDHPLRG
jgi:hypothetical protein